MTQSPLIQDGGLDDQNVRIGTNTRLWEYDLKTRKSREFLYTLDDKSLGISDLEMIESNRLLVLERDSKPGEAAEVKRLYEIDLAQATDISDINRLPSTGVPDGIHSVKKTLFLDLLAPEYALAGNEIPEKVEGVTLGPKLADGSTILIVTSDNDFRPDQPTQIYVFAVK
jgi:hypothetical protein